MTASDAHGELRKGDISNEALSAARRMRRVAWDIETTGLDWREDEIRTCQVAVGGDVSVVQLHSGVVPPNLAVLLADPSVTKVFHHAPFDLRFMASAWKVLPASVACTKIAAKIVEPGRHVDEYSLKAVLDQYLNVKVDKSEQLSDWSRATLTQAQLDYAANDVAYLTRLLDRLMVMAQQRGVDSLVLASYDYLPTRVQLDILGAWDVFDY